MKIAKFGWVSPSTKIKMTGEVEEKDIKLVERGWEIFKKQQRNKVLKNE